MKKGSLLLIPGDGVGPEIFESLRPVLEKLRDHATLDLDICWQDAGHRAYLSHGATISPELLVRASHSDAVLFGAEDSEAYTSLPPSERPASALLQLRHALGGYSNLRPIRMLPSMAALSPLRAEIVRNVDFVIVRELLGGLYFGEPRGIVDLPGGGQRAVDTMVYETGEIERVAHAAFSLARERQGRLCSVDKANVLACSHLWRQTVSRIGLMYPNVELSHMYVDNCAMQLIRRPSQFDVILTENTFGDILSDCAAVITGSIGMLPSACLGDLQAPGRSRGLYEPIHGSAPDIAGMGIANPIGTVLSLAMALRHSLESPALAAALEAATAGALQAGLLTRDLGGTASTHAMGRAIAERFDF